MKQENPDREVRESPGFIRGEDVNAPDPVRRAALQALREGRVLIYRSSTEIDGVAPDLVAARVNSSRQDHPPHYIDLRGGEGTCTCGGTACRHVYATKLVTGWADVAA